MNQWKNKRVLITGCNGFVGAHLVRKLIDGGAEVTGVIRDIPSRSALTMLGCEDDINIIYGDIEDSELTERVLNEYSVEVCFHLAAQSQVGVANRSPFSTFKTNIMGTLNILEAARRLGTLKALVIASSDKAYGAHNKLPYREDFALKGTYPYDASKASADILSQSYFHTYGLHVAIARCGNIYGPCDMNLRRIVPDIIRSICAGERPSIRSDGTYVRDYIFVGDAISAYILLAEALLKDKKGVAGEAFNFGAGKPVSVMKLVDTIIRISGKDTRPRILNIAAGEIQRQYLSSKKAERVLGWRPLHTLIESLSSTYEWYERFFKENPR